MLAKRVHDFCRSAFEMVIAALCMCRLRAFKGIGTLTALAFVLEIGDFRRFARAEQFTAFLGLVPCEHSSGEKRRLGNITKAGNSHLRKLLVEVAWVSRRYGAPSKRLMRERAEVSTQIAGYVGWLPE